MTTTRRAAGVTVLVAVAVVAAVLTCTAWAGSPAPGAAALAAPAEFGVSGTSVLRLTAHPEERDEAFRVVRDLGSGWLRVDVQWDTIEARKGFAASPYPRRTPSLTISSTVNEAFHRTSMPILTNATTMPVS